MNDLVSAIEEVSVDLRGIRLNQPMIEKGRVVSKPQEEHFDFRGSFQPMGLHDLMRLPEGLRQKGAAKLYTTCELLTANVASGKLPDRVECNGIIYQVESVEDWFELGGYYEVLLTRMDR